MVSFRKDDGVENEVGGNLTKDKRMNKPPFFLVYRQGPCYTLSRLTEIPCLESKSRSNYRLDLKGSLIRSLLLVSQGDDPFPRGYLFWSREWVGAVSESGVEESLDGYR